MTRIERFPEYRLVVPGRAVSFRSPNAMRYRADVRRVASRVFAQPLTGDKLEVLLDYFHVQSRRFDMDNVAKCVLDALTGVAYRDDKQVRNQAAVAHDLRDIVRIDGGPVALVEPLRCYEEYLFVRVQQRERG